jgi:hypothetical protein
MCQFRETPCDRSDAVGHIQHKVINLAGLGILFEEGDGGRDGLRMPFPQNVAHLNPCAVDLRSCDMRTPIKGLDRCNKIARRGDLQMLVNECKGSRGHVHRDVW